MAKEAKKVKEPKKEPKKKGKIVKQVKVEDTGPGNWDI